MFYALRFDNILTIPGHFDLTPFVRQPQAMQEGHSDGVGVYSYVSHTCSIFDHRYAVYYRRYKLNASYCTSKKDCLQDRLNLKPSLVLLICRRHLFDYTDGYTPNGFRTKGLKRVALCSRCPENNRLAVRQLNRTSIDIFKKHWGQHTVIGTPVCRACYDECAAKHSVEEQRDTTPRPSHNQPATEIVTDEDGVTTIFSQEAHHSQNDNQTSPTTVYHVSSFSIYIFI